MMAASSSGRSPLDAVAGPLHADDRRRRLAAQQLGDVLVVDDRPGQAAHEQHGDGEPRDRIPQVAELGVRRPGLGGLGAEAGVAPDPAAVLALDRVVQDAASQRGLAAAGVVLDGPRQQVVEAVEAGGAVDEVGDRRRLLRVHAGRDVDEHERAHELGRVVGQRERRHAAERHPDDAARLGRQLGDHRGEVPPVGGGRDGAVGPPVGVAVARAGRRRGADGRAPARRCPRCGRSARRRAPAPARAARCGRPRAGSRPVRPGLHLDVDALHVGRAVVGDAVLGRVLVEQAELVVGNQLRHATSVPYARRAARRAKNAADARAPPLRRRPGRR